MKDKSEVEGTWKVSHKGTRYTFIPSHDLTRNEKYSINISTGVKDTKGIHLDRGKDCTFHCCQRNRQLKGLGTPIMENFNGN